MNDRFTFTDFYMFFANPFIQWNLRRKTILAMQVMPRDKMLEKKFEWINKLRVAEKVENTADFVKFRHYLDVLELILNEKID